VFSGRAAMALKVEDRRRAGRARGRRLGRERHGGKRQNEDEGEQRGGE
jgi:hypothetical protein